MTDDQIPMSNWAQFVAVPLLMSCFVAGCSQGPTGAALFWTSDDATVCEARALSEDGRFVEAEALMAAITNDTLRVDGLDVLKRLRSEYTLTDATMLAAVQDQVADATLDDLYAWRDAGHIRYRNIDGETRYFKRAYQNLFRFCEAAKQRRDRQPTSTGPSAAKQQLHAHIRTALDQSAADNALETAGLKHRITYKITVDPKKVGAKIGSTVRCWMPLPQEYRQQKNARLVRTQPIEHERSKRSPHRTIYFEQTVMDAATPMVFEEVFEYDSYAYCPQLCDEKATTDLPSWTRTYLEPRLPHIAFTNEIKQTVADIIGNETNPLIKARLIFEYIDRETRWNSELEYCVIPCFVDKIMQTKRGDCGIKSMLLITMCRVAGVPARWQSGWVTQPDDWNLHDWSEIYVEPWGWLPVDVSYGVQKSDDPEIRMFYFGHQDAYRLIVNMDYGYELEPAKKFLRSEPADFQRGEVELDDRNLFFTEWDWAITFDVMPIEEQ